MEAVRDRRPGGPGVVGMSGDLIDQYLTRLRASLRTPPDRTEQILTEAEDHLRESAAAGEALGLTEREAQESAIAAFGQVRAVVRAHRRPAAVASELCMAACKIATVYLLVVAATSVLMTIPVDLLARQLHVIFRAGMPVGFVTGRHGSTTVFVPVTIVGVAIAVMIALAGYWWLRRLERRRRAAQATLLGGYFPLFAAICMLIFGPIVVLLTAIITPPHTHTAFEIPVIAAVAGSVAMALAYTVQMVRAMIRQGRDAGTTGREADYA
jgi:uncharacterized membrane protein